MSADIRYEEDLLGTVPLPADALYGAHSERSRGDVPPPHRRVHPELARAYGTVKLACARTNLTLGVWAGDDVKADAIERACRELGDGLQCIRDLMDSDAIAVMVKERELGKALAALEQTPKLVVTDSQAFLKVAADTPLDVPMTSFSILFARFKGDLTSQVEGTLAVDDLKAGARILVAEACSHHPIAADIGRVKIPRWLRQYVGGRLDIQHVQGHDFPDDLAGWDLVIHCGACSFNRREMLGRILRCRQAGVPITNYGLVIAYSLGIFERALQPFPAALEALRAAQARRAGRAAAEPVTAGLAPGAAVDDLC